MEIHSNGVSRKPVATPTLPVTDELKSLMASKGFKMIHDESGYKIIEIGRRKEEIHQAACLLIGAMALVFIAVVVWVPTLVFKIVVGFIPLVLSIAVGYGLVESYLWKAVLRRRETNLLLRHGIGVFSKSISLATDGSTLICSELMIRTEASNLLERGSLFRI